MAGRRILVTGVANFWGSRLAHELAGDPEVERVVGLDTRSPGRGLLERITFVQTDLRAAGLATIVRAAAVDTVVHNDVLQFAEPGRDPGELHDINVVGTLRLLAACSGLPLRALVVRSSAAIYGAEPSAPSFITEAQARGAVLRTRFQRDVGELERLVEGFARRSPAVACTVLRLQPVVGPALDTPVSRLVRAPVVLTVAGFDPRLQVLDEDDSVGALLAAVRTGAAAGRDPVRGAVNVGARDPVSLSCALRRLGRRSVPVAAPLYGRVAGALARAGGLPPLSEDIVRYLRHGRTVDTARMRSDLAFEPRRSTMEALERAAAREPARSAA